MRCRSLAHRRCGVAAVELAVLLPFLAFMFVAAVDFARVFYHCVVITNCARDGAVYGSSDPSHATDGAGIQAVALADAANLSPAPSVSSATGTDVTGSQYVDVTVTVPFQTVSRFPGIPSAIALTRTVRMRVAPTTPKNP